MSRSALLLSIAVFLDMFGFGMLIPGVQLRLDAMGATGPLIGLVQASTFAIQTLFSPLWGRFGDRAGRRTAFLLCTLLSASSYVIYGLASSIALIAVSRGVAGLGGANVVAAQAMAGAEAGERKAVALGRLGAALSAGLIAGPAAGGLIAKFSGPMTVGLVAACSSFVGIVLVFFFVPKDQAKTAEDSGPKKLKASLLKNPNVAKLVVLAGVAWFSLSCLEGTFGRLIKAQHGFGEFEFGILFGFESAVAVTIQSFGIAPIKRWLGERSALVIGYLLQGLGLALTPLMPGLGALFGTSLCYSAGQSVANPLVNSRASAAVEESRQGELFGIMQAARSIGFIFGPLMGGWLFDMYPPLPYYVAGVVCLSAALLTPLAVPKDKPAASVTL